MLILNQKVILKCQNFYGSLSSTSFIDWEATRWKDKLKYYIATFFKLLCVVYKVKKRENLYLQYWLNLRQVAEKKTHYVQTPTCRKGKRRENLKQLFGKQPFWYPWRVPRMKLIIKQSSPTPSIVSSRVPTVPQHSILETFNPFSSLNVIRQITCLYKKKLWFSVI